jgi:cation diffusion facilitator family transporter
MTESFAGFFEVREQTDASKIVVYLILGISIIAKLFLALHNRRVGKLIESGVVSASATDSLMDAVSTLAVLITSIVIDLTGLWFLDSVVGIAVSVMILIAGLRILNETKNSLLGEAPVDEMIKSIKDVVAKYPEVLGVHDMLVHNYGPNHYFASFHAEVDGKADVFIIHDAIDNLEREINDSLGILCTVHMDPIEMNDEEVVSMRRMTGEIVSSLYNGASIHDFRMVTGVTHTNLIFDIVVPFEISDDPSVIIKSVESEIKKVNPNYFIVVTIDRG